MSAVISPCGKYRYLLSRRTGLGSGRCVFIMLNPSTADAETDDPTIRRCMAYARAWDYAQLDVINLYAYRSTDPHVMLSLPHAHTVGPDNYHYVSATCHRADMVICAWGNHGVHRSEGMKTLEGLRAVGVKPYALKINKATGQPAHPLYLKSDLVPFPI